MLPKINIGYFQDKGTWYRDFMEWKDTKNGFLIAGQSGSGKSNFLAYVLTQYALYGAKLIIADYDGGMDETLIQRIGHLAPSYLFAPVTQPKDIERYISLVFQLGQLRLSGAIPKENHYPLIFVIDEFSAFIMRNKVTKKTTKKRETTGNETVTEEQQDANYLETLLEGILKYRKVNIRFILAGQEWAQMGTANVRALRSAFSNTIIHSLDESAAKLFLIDKKKQMLVQSLDTGEFYFNEFVHYAPELSEAFITRAHEKLQHRYAVLPRAWSDEQCVSHLLERCEYTL